MKHNPALIAFTLFVPLLLLVSCNREIHAFQPDIPYGGRIVALGHNLSQPNKIIAASPSGGLFRSYDYGRTWMPIPLPVFAIEDIAISPSDPSLVIITTGKDLKVKNGGGIWRSVDGGVTWKQANYPLPTNISGSQPIHGYGIAFEPGSARVYAGTSGGLAISEDNGLNWRIKTPCADSFCETPNNDFAVVSVLAQANGRALAATSSGIYRTTDGGVKWKKVSDFSNLSSVRAFCAVPGNNERIFFTDNKYEVYFSQNFGLNWVGLNAPVADKNNQPPFIRFTNIARTAEGMSAKPGYLYYGNGIHLFRKLIPNASQSQVRLDFSRPWENVPIPHADPSDMIFNESGDPVLLAGDFGLASTPDKGNTWEFIGGGKNGLNALQIYEITGQDNFSGERKKCLYFGTHDNGFWASEDGGLNWSKGTGGEGHSIQTKRRALSVAGNLMSYVTEGDFQIIQAAEAGMKNSRLWKNPPGKINTAPVIIPDDDLLAPAPLNHFIQFTEIISPGQPRTLRLNQTYNGGDTWNTLLQFQTDHTVSKQYPKIAKDGSVWVFQPLKWPNPVPDKVQNQYILLKISGLGAPVGGIKLDSANGNGFGNLGEFKTGFIRYNVFSVNPSNPNHLMMADIKKNYVQTSRDGGKNWYPELGLTQLVTNNWNLKFSAEPGQLNNCIVTCIAFNPDDTRQIVVGTTESGVMASEDGGESWYQLKNTTHITNCSSLFFDFDEHLIISTYGKGLYRLKLGPSAATRSRKTKSFSGYAWYPATGRVKQISRLEDPRSFADQHGYRLLTQLADPDLTLEKIAAQGIKQLHAGQPDQKEMRPYPILSGRLNLPGRISKNKAMAQLPIRAIALNTRQEVVGFVIGNNSYRLYAH